ncbi:PKD domain-containing protein [Kibdelosporangium philippinense]
MIRTKRWTGAAAAVACLAGVVVLGMGNANQAPQLRLHGGSAWLASSKTGQLTLLDGASAEVAARVQVAPPGAPIRSAQLESTGYALNQWDGSVVRVDGATLKPSTSSWSADKIFPTPHALYALDSSRGLLTPTDLVTMTPLGAPHSLATKADQAVVDGGGRLWILDQHTGELVWFSQDSQGSRTNAGTHLTVTDGRPAVLDVARRKAELLDPETGTVVESVRADVRADDAAVVSGWSRGILISTRGLLMACEFTVSCRNPVALGSGKADLGAAVEVAGHAIVPDYSAGRAWVVNLETMRVVADRKLFDRPVRFELLARDGLVFYNDPDSDEAGVFDLNGNGRAVSKYNPVNPGSGINQVAVDGPGPGRQSPPPRPESGSPNAPVRGPGANELALVGAPMADIVFKPGNRGLVGDEFELGVVARSSIGLATAEWSFGDGTSATGLVARHSWKRPGEYQVSVATMLTVGLPAPVATATVVIEPADAPPRIAGFRVDPEAPRAGEPVLFGAEVTGRAPDRWEWTVQGQPVSSEPEFRHTFAAPGTYTVALAVTAGAVRVQESKQVVVAPAPPRVKCGDVLTASAVLTGDLVCPQNVAFRIAADNVTFDLGSHTVTTASPSNSSVGIQVAGAKNATIKNGSVTGFTTGIAMTDVNGVAIQKIRSKSFGHDSAGDIVGTRATNVKVTDSTTSGPTAFVFRDRSNVTFSKATFEQSAVSLCSDHSTCAVTGSSTVRIDRLVCARNEEDTDSGSSITIRDSALDIAELGHACDDVKLTTNQSTGGDITATNNLELVGNVMGDRQDDLVLDSPAVRTPGRLVIQDNMFSGFGVGLRIGEGTGTISGNVFSGNVDAGIWLDPSPGQLTFAGNTFTANGSLKRHGVPAEYRGGLIDPELGRQSVTLSDNHAVNNRGYGFRVATGVQDGGGNTSSGDLHACVGVSCAP